MVFLRVSLFAIYAAAATVLAAYTPTPPTAPSVTLDRGLFTGTTANGTNKFLGIPFAQLPSVIDIDFGSAPLCHPRLTCQTNRVGNLRFRHPQPPNPYVGKHNATAFGLSCPQQASGRTLPSGLPPPTLAALQGLGATPNSVGEDCKKAIWELLTHTKNNVDGSCRFDC